MPGRKRRHVRAQLRAGAVASIARALAGAVVVLCVVALPRSALADSRTFALAWSASEEQPCVSTATLQDAVVARLGRNPFVPLERADVVLHGRELPPSARGRARARVEQRDQEGRVLGSRDLEAASCAELAQSAAFVIVLIVDPDALFRDPPPEPASYAYPGGMAQRKLVTSPLVDVQ